MKIKDNYGEEGKSLTTGYSDTGFIPDIGDNVVTKKKKEKDEYCMCSRLGWDMEDESGGFLERKNTDDRM